MKTRRIVSFGLSSLVLGGTMVGCAGTTGGVASASDRSGALAAKGSSSAADSAKKALARREPAVAVGFAETAVAAAPQDARYRALLGQSYMQAGRFASAGAAFADALALSPHDGRVALNLALAQIATGDAQAARTTLSGNMATIPAADLGLAMALAGDTRGGIAVLTEIARSPQSSAKVRQNLALSLALSGQWPAARVVASADLSPGDIDARLQQWAAFAHPDAASDQVASLLGVHAVADLGQPVALALNAPVPVGPVPVGVTPVEQAAVARDEPVAVAAALVEPVPVAPPVAAPMIPVVQTGMVSAPPHAVVQNGSAPILPSATSPIKIALGRAAPVEAPGTWFVQIGAFRTMWVAKDAWSRASHRFTAFAGHAPTGMTFQSRGMSVYRLSIGGFSRASADTICRKYRATGGACFVRAGAGDQMARWLRKPGMQVASR